MLGTLLREAHRTGPIKGYPLRVDFPDAPVSARGVLLVGEAAGLVNPLTGEGIDYALESAQIAAEHASRMLSVNGRGEEEHTEYERLLHTRFGRLFGFCRRLREATVHTVLLNQLVRVAARRDDLKMRLIVVVLGAREIPAQLSTRTVLRKAYSLIR